MNPRPDPSPPAAGQPASSAGDAARAAAAQGDETVDYREIYEQFPAQVILEDFSTVARVFAEMRAAGVTDFMSHLALHPELPEMLAPLVRVLDANPEAVAAAGLADTAAMRANFTRLRHPPLPEVFRLQLAAFWDGRSLCEDEFHYRDAQGDDRACFMRCAVPLRAGQLDGHRVTLMLLDVTTAKRTITARLEAQSLLRESLARANILLWWAKVRYEGGRYRWKIDLPKQSIDSPIYRLATAIDRGGLWDNDNTPDLAAMTAMSESALRDRRPGYQHEFRVLGPDGTRWLGEDVRINPIAAEEWILVGVITDVTLRHEAEEAMRQSEAQIQQLLQRADCMLWQARVTENARHGFDWAIFIPESVLHRRLFGDGVAGRPQLMWSELNVPELPEMNVRSTCAIRENRPGYEQEFRAYREGHTFWLHEQVSIDPVAPGCWNVVGVVTDLSSRREAEAALAAERERLTVTLRAMNEGVITPDIKGVVQFINRAAESLVQHEAAAAVGRPVAELCDLQDVRNGQTVAFPLARVVADGAMVEIPPHTRLRGAHGSLCLVEGCCVPVRDAEGRTIGGVFVFRDTTERQRLEEEVQRAAKLESVGLLAGGIAHDFNNLLTAIMGNLALASLDAHAIPGIADCLDEAQRATMRARDLTQQLLTFAKGGEPIRAAVHLAETVSEVALFTLHGSRVGCEFALARDLWPADVDKGQIGQVVQNLVLNAVQAMPEGGSLRISAENEVLANGAQAGLAGGNYVRLSFSDTGSGIPAEHLAKIFDPYFTTKRSGSGLGLATVYSIVRKHKGAIDVASEVGRGTTFTIRLPAAAGAAPLPAAVAPPTLGRLTGRVLFMDDEEPIRKIAARLLTRLGLDVEVTADGAAAVAAFQAARVANREFAIVIMDLTVPGGMGGCETLEAIRRIDPDVRAIVSSGYSGDAALADFRTYGFQARIAKPYEFEEFARVVNEVLAAPEGRG